jgi:hypothetical protein
MEHTATHTLFAGAQPAQGTQTLPEAQSALLLHETPPHWKTVERQTCVPSVVRSQLQKSFELHGL